MRIHKMLKVPSFLKKGLSLQKKIIQIKSELKSTKNHLQSILNKDSFGNFSHNFSSILNRPEVSQRASLSQRVEVINHLQRIYGNKHVQRMICAKLKIGQPGDIYEQEADRVAEQVMNIPEAEIQQNVGHEQKEKAIQSKQHIAQFTPKVQRQVEEEEEEENLQAKYISGHTSEAAPDLETRVKGRGRPLQTSTRAFFEPRFGSNFSQVKVHSDARAAKSAEILNARAYTVGQNIVFGKGQYSPWTAQGKQLLAHELTHVVQQNQMGKQKLLRFYPESDVSGIYSFQKGLQFNKKKTDPATEEFNKSTLIQRHFGNLAKYKKLRPLYHAAGVANIDNWIRTTIKIGTLLGKRTSVHKNLVNPLNKTDTALKGKGVTINRFGGFVPRENRSRPGVLSNHAFGRAVDIDSPENPMINTTRRKIIEKVTTFPFGATYKDIKKSSNEFKTKFTADWVKNQKKLRDELKGNYLKKKTALNKNAYFKQKQFYSQIVSNRTWLNRYALIGFLNHDEMLVTELGNAGFNWGALWTSPKDIMHFEIPGAP